MLVIHIVFALTSLISFISRVLLAQFKPQMLNERFFKTIPHVIDSFLLASGAGLVVHGAWLDGDDYGWIISKFIMLLLYIGLGVLTMRSNGMLRGIGFIGALACYGYILTIAVSKQGFL